MNKLEERKLQKDLISQLHLIKFKYVNKNASKQQKLLSYQLLLELNNLGYSIHNDTFSIMKNKFIDNYEQIFKNIYQSVQEIIGDNHAQPLFPMFPNYDNISNNELKFLNIIHYVTDCRYGDNLNNELDNLHLRHFKRPNIILSKYTHSKAFNFIISFLTSSTVKDASDRELAKLLVHSNPYLLSNKRLNKLDFKIIKPLKENLTFIVSLVIKYTQNNRNVINKLKMYFSNPIDVLRLSYYLMDKNLKDNNQYVFFKFSRPTIKYLLSLLEHSLMSKSGASSMRKYANGFKMLGKELHPTTKKHLKDFPLTYKAYYDLMNNRLTGDPRNKLINDIFNKENISNDDFIKLQSEPTLFFKFLYPLLNTFPVGKDLILNTMEEVIDKVNPLALMQGFRIFATDDYKPLYLINNKYTLQDDVDFSTLDYDTRQKVAQLIMQGLQSHNTHEYGNKNIYINDELKNIALPINERITGTQFLNVPKMSRLSIPDDVNSLRTFVYWKNGLKNQNIYDRNDNVIDLDSSLVAYGDNIKPSYASWNSDFVTDTGLKHSGDITDADPNAIEYQDIDINTLKQHGYKYVVLSITSYTGQKFSDMRTASVGIMENDNKKIISELWTPENVMHNIQLIGNSTNNIAFILDIYNRDILIVNSPINMLQGNNMSVFNSDTNKYEMITKELEKQHVLTIGQLAKYFYKGQLINDLNNVDADNTILFTKPTANNQIDFSKIFPGLF